MFQCSGCKHARFCSARCQKAMAGVHMLECGALTRLPLLAMEGESAPLRMLIRIAYLQQQERVAARLKEKKAAGASGAASSSSGKDAAPAQPKLVWMAKPGQSFADAASLISHEEDYDGPTKATLLLAINQLQHKVIADDDIWREMSMHSSLKILLAIQCNAHHITDSGKNKIGLGLFIPAAYLNHSCRPNCAYFFDDQGRMVMQSIRPIAAGDELTYQYIDPYQSRADRARTLKQVFFIDQCQCDRCTKTQERGSEDALMRAMVCSACAANPLLDSKPADAAPVGEPAAAPATATGGASKWPVLRLDKSNSGNMTCPSCSKAYKAADIAELVHNVGLLSERATLMLQSGDVADALAFLEERVLYVSRPPAVHPFMHPYHAALFNVYLLLLSISQSSRAQVPATATLRYASYVIECLAAQQLDVHPEAAEAHRIRGNALAELDNERRAKGAAAHQEAGEGELTEVVPLVRKDGAAAAAAAPAPLHLASAAWESYSRAFAVLQSCYGADHPQTKAVRALLAELQDAHDRHTGKGIYDANFDDAKSEHSDATAPTKGKKQNKKKK